MTQEETLPAVGNDKRRLRRRLRDLERRQRKAFVFFL
jgi:hypothetical protein